MSRLTVAATLTALHEQVFASEYGDGTAFGSLADVWADSQFMGEEGTHTIIDVYRIVDTSEAPDWRSGNDYNTMRPLSQERTRYWFETDQPSLSQYETLRDEQDRNLRGLRGEAFLHRPMMLMDENTMRWTGTYLILYTDAEPTHVAFWGGSGD
jgi:hypothetical protein